MICSFLLTMATYTYLLCLTFPLAFDTIDHSTLVHHLHTDFGFTDTALQWFLSYLTDHTQYVSSSSDCSAFTPVHSSVPRGSVLGNIFFPCTSSLCLPLLIHTLSRTIHLLMTYNYRCQLFPTKYRRYFTLCSHA